MNDVFGKVVAQANNKGTYLTEDEFSALQRVLSDANKRLDAVNRLTSNASKIVTDAARSLFAEESNLIAPGGNAYPARNMAACLRDMDIILRYITYAVASGDVSVLNERCLNGLRETYQALGVPGASVANGVQKMKVAAVAIVNDPNGITRGDCSALVSELETYFDRAGSAVS
ncbi:MAG: phycocyanin subunit beta [Synechococcaceae cyanobacterium SM2_3_1]|nr:phycocyanin subunit beta [Synechococcaceae cyanobacterium SM2_3_1]